MDHNQRKLNKSEWDSIEQPAQKKELEIYDLIIKGNSNVNIRINYTDSIFTFLKIEYSEKMEDYLFNKYLRSKIEKIEELIKQFDKEYNSIKIDINVKIKSADKIRLEKNDESILAKQEIYEFVLLENIDKLLHYKFIKNDVKIFSFYYYTLYKLIRNNVEKINRHVTLLTNKILNMFEDNIQPGIIIENSVDFIEKNSSLLKYDDLVLYEHQKQVITSCKIMNPKLILYMAPTGTGKTLTPLALSENNRIIFVCAARHVGLALARAAISINKKIAFAFGCASAADIRLHYFAAKEFTKNTKTGGIFKVDNSIGTEVEIMICDIKSYLPAMYYMKSFNPVEKIITYWDEPTITLDYSHHEFHEIIKENWKQNLIPNMVLSSATLPKEYELELTIPDFKEKFAGAEIINIVSHDCKKSIPIINNNGQVVLPHYLKIDYEELLEVAKHCENNLTLLRYFDLKEVVDFITFVLKQDYANLKMKLKRHFETLDQINMTNIKIYYVKLLQNIIGGTWGAIYIHFRLSRKPRIYNNESVDTKGNRINKIRSVGPGTSMSSSSSSNKFDGQPLTRISSEQITSSATTDIVGTSGIYVTTKDAYTLKDGPTIFITDEIQKIANFCIQQANIPSIVMDDLMKKIEYNNVLNNKLHELENNLEYIKEKLESNAKSSSSSGGRQKSNKDCRKINRDAPEDVDDKKNMKGLTGEINTIRSMIKTATLNDMFIPNKHEHIEKWTHGLDTKNAFTSNIDESVVNEIMLLKGIDDSWKILLIMGIGVFINHENIKYTEIMKKMADEQKLFMIIANSDYIYGTNYQFCHGFIGKDLNLTQEKIIQAMGRIGRNNVQQSYTMRFRDDKQILKLFTAETEKPEIINMNKLFNSQNVVWENGSYKVLEDVVV